ncbi:MAG: NAD(P)H-binding protein [Deltaproteobacteria bacterium]|nr:NAD(P)H-binding protein [Deltaproteobacteria bacterium]
MSQLHVVFGAGQIGLPLAKHLLAAGHRVRQVTRSGTAAEGAEAFVADLSDPEQAIAATAGADVVYQVINAPYTKWATLLEPLQRGALAGVKAAGARFVVLDNLYSYGVPDGPIRPDSPMTPCSKKGAIRKRLHELLTGPEASGVQVAIARASDFVGPDVTEAIFSGDSLRSFAGGGRIPLPGNADLPRGYSYGPDVVEGLAALGADPEAEGVFMLPTVNTTSNELLSAVTQASGVAGKTLGMPRWLLKSVGLLVPMARELEEMAYQWEVPYTVDCSVMEQRYSIRPTPLSEIAQAIVASARPSRAAA